MQRTDTNIFSGSESSFRMFAARLLGLAGEVVAQCCQDYSTRFWSRARPGDTSFSELLPKRVGVKLAN